MALELNELIELGEKVGVDMNNADSLAKARTHLLNESC